jgi:SpoVK/Ycf46/Vps4 family AAA+-type ATPase
LLFKGRSDSLLYHKVSIGFLISLFCEGLGEQIKARIYFYRNSRLVSEGLINVSDPPLLNRGNFLDNGVELDKRLLDYIVGLDTEINELVDGSDLYTPQVTLLDVALPSDQRQLLLSTLDSFKKFQETCKELKLSTHGYSKGLCLLFYGPSGTGKTMTANAIASHLGKKLLLVTVSILTEAQLTKDLLRFLFREAKIHNAIIFFDECEPLFETRDNRTNTSLALLLTEIEQYDGIIFLATNRHQDLDEAMHRRIQLALPFTVPDYTLRMEIWKTHIPDMLADKDSIDWSYLAQSYELTGGLIRNAILSAISFAAKEETNLSNKIVLTTQDLHRGAKLQLRGLLEMVDFERRIIPTYGLDELVLDDGTFKHIETLINAGKTHKFISTQWGFSSGTSAVNVAQATGIVCLLYGAAGVGKTSIANAVAYELGQPIKEAICTELLSHSVSSNPRSARGIASFFKDAQRANAIIVLDGAEFVLGIGSNSLASGLVGCEIYSLAYQIERYPGMVVLISRQNIGLLDLSRLPKLRFVIPVNWPNVKLREKLWKKLLPKKLPLADDIDAVSLAERFQFNGGEISCVICSAAETVATTNGRLVDNQLMIEAAENYLKINNLGKNENLLFQ